MSSTIDEQFVEYVVKTIVGDPDSVNIVRTIDEKGVLLELTVAQDDLGRVIGKRGSTAQSIRTLLRALGTKNEARYNLKIIDPEDDGTRERRPRNDESASAPAAADDSGTVAASDDATASTDEVAEEIEEVAVAEEVAEEPQEESLADKTRKELEDLDDLDI